jgi:hypothetical protein
MVNSSEELYEKQEFKQAVEPLSLKDAVKTLMQLRDSPEAMKKMEKALLPHLQTKEMAELESALKQNLRGGL